MRHVLGSVKARALISNQNTLLREDLKIIRSQLSSVDGGFKIKKAGTCQEERWQSLENVVSVGCWAVQLGKCWRWVSGD